MATSDVTTESHELADAMPHVVWTHDADGVVGYFNRAWVAYTGADLAAVRAHGAASFVHPDDHDRVVQLFTDARRLGTPLETTYRLRRHDGVYRWHLARMTPLRRDGARVTQWVGTAIDIDEARRGAVEKAYLADAGRVLGSSLDVKRTLADVAAMVVPELADWCAIDLRDETGAIERATVAHVDPAKVALAWDLWRRQPPRPDDPSGIAAVIRERRTEHLTDIPDELLVAATQDPDILATLRALGLRSSMCVPLIGRSAVLGALTLVAAESGRRYEARDLEFAEEVARRIAIAVENAQLYTTAQEARAAAEALAADVAEQSRAVQLALTAMRRERDQALARLEALAPARDGSR